jgi:hypothetical protein
MTTTKLLVPLALAALVAPVALAGPPAETAGRMVLDEVADGLRRYAREGDAKKAIDTLKRLAPTCDPRVAVVLFDRFETARRKQVRIRFDRDEDRDELDMVMRLLEAHYLPPLPPPPPPPDVGFGPPSPTGTFQKPGAVVQIVRLGQFRKFEDRKEAIWDWWFAAGNDMLRQAQQLPK